MSKIKIIVVIVVLLVAGFFAYSYFFVKNGDLGISVGGLMKTDVSSITDVNTPVTQTFLNQLAVIKTIDLKNDVLKDPVFAGLVDSSRDLGSETPGRPNPFAPLSTSTSLAVDNSVNAIFYSSGQTVQVGDTTSTTTTKTVKSKIK